MRQTDVDRQFGRTEQKRRRMKNYLYILILISIVTCKEEHAINAQEKKSENIETIEKTDDNIRKIGKLYKPEKFIITPGKISAKNKKQNYQITLFNSDLLDNKEENLKNHAKEIANLYHKSLINNSITFNFNKIIVEIEHRNGKKENFKFSEKDFLINEIEFPINTKFTIKVTKIDNLNFKYSTLKVEPFNKKLEMWNTENLFE